MNYYKFHIGDYRRDTSHLSMLEHGAYRQLLDSYYLNEKPLPLDDAILMRTHCARTADEMQAIKNVLADFFLRTEEGWVHKHCERALQAYKAKSDKARESASARWQKENPQSDANAMRTHSEGNANHKPITNNQEPIKKQKQKHIRASRFDAQAHLVSENVPEDLAADWLKLRKLRRLAPTKTAFDGVKREAEKAGLSLAQAITKCCEKGWGGFEAGWVENESRARVLSFQRAGPISIEEQNARNVQEALRMAREKNQRMGVVIDA
jgi:uncharacterized protein YdaU (DUF1376 family)